MYDEGKHPIYQYSEEEKREVRRQLGLSEKMVQESVDAVLEWFLKQPHLMSTGIIDRRLVERMLLMAKGSVERTKHRIDNLYKYRGLIPELMQKRVVELDSPPEHMFDNFFFSPMTKLYEGKRVTIIQTCLTDDVSRFSIEAIFRVSCMVGDIRMQYDYMAGDIWIINFQNFTVSHLLRLNPLMMKKGALLLQEGYGIRVQAIHLYNVGFNATIIRQALDFLKQFLKSKMIDRLMLHEKIEDVYKYVPKEYLPKDLGGDQPSVQYMTSKLEEELRKIKTKEFLMQRRELVSDESKRPGSKINEEFLEGSFRTLDID